MASDLQFARLEVVMRKPMRNGLWCVLTMINLLLVSCPAILFRRAQTREEHVIAVLVLLGCFCLLALIDAVGIAISDGLTESAHGDTHHERAESELRA